MADETLTTPSTDGGYSRIRIAASRRRRCAQGNRTPRFRGQVVKFVNLAQESIRPAGPASG